MPYGPRAGWRPSDPGACAVHVRKLATGEIDETYQPPTDPVKTQQANENL